MSRRIVFAAFERQCRAPVTDFQPEVEEPMRLATIELGLLDGVDGVIIPLHIPTL